MYVYIGQSSVNKRGLGTDKSRGSQKFSPGLNVSHEFRDPARYDPLPF
jgi:hypothetical protein